MNKYFLEHIHESLFVIGQMLLFYFCKIFMKIFYNNGIIVIIILHIINIDDSVYFFVKKWCH